jgi:glutathione S-transferase
LDFDEQQVSTDDPSTRAELLLLSPSFLVPCLTHNGLKIWDTLAIAEYLHEIRPDAGLFPSKQAQRRIAARSAARCIRVSVICVPPCR